MAILGRSRPIRPHLAQPIAGAPVVPSSVIAGATVVLASSTKRGAFERRKTFRPHLPPSITGTPASVSVVPGATLVLNKANKASRPDRRGVPRPHLPPRTLTPPPQTPTIRVSAARRPPFPRPPRAHLSPPVIPVVSTASPPLPVLTPLLQSITTPRIPRSAPRPHLVKPRLVQPPLQRPKVVKTVKYREFIGRTVPHPHLAPPVPPAAIVAGPPVKPGTFVIQTLRRLAQRIRPRPHVTGPIVGPFVPPPPAAPISFVASLPDGPNWSAYVSDYRWSTQMGATRWDAEIGPPRWSTEVSRNA